MSIYSSPLSGSSDVFYRKLREAFPEPDSTVASQRQARALPAAQATQIAIGLTDHQREGLYVPMLYAGWMGQNGKWERWQCDARAKGDKAVRVKGTNAGNSAGKMLTDSLATCISISVISKQGGSIMTHFTPDVASILLGKTVDDPTGAKQQQATNIKTAMAALLKKHLKDMGGANGVVVEAVAGPQSAAATGEDSAKALATLFGLKLDSWRKLNIPNPNFSGERSATIDMTTNPPTYYVENTLVPITVP